MIKKSLASLVVMFTLTLSPVMAAERLEVVAKNGDPKELAIKARVEALVKKYALEKWLYTGHVVIDKNTWPPHSHPVLTLGVRDEFLSDDVALVANLIHEEFHWNIVLNSRFGPDETTALVKAQFPGLNPKMPYGSGTEGSTYGHVLVCYMEYKALAAVFGESVASRSLAELPYYKSVYQIVIDKKNHVAIESILRASGVTM